MRLFIALDLPEAVRNELTGVQHALRAFPLRLTAVAGLHLTLQFLGETPAELVEPLLAALRTIPAPPCKLSLSGLGAFPNLRQPRIVWSGVAGERTALAERHAAVTAATAPLGFGAEARPFAPHLTLGRVRQEARPEQLKALGEALACAAPPAPIAWDAGRPVLFQSTLTPRGAVYTLLGP